jgi:Holin of 3TMs, for gene-transfer release
MADLTGVGSVADLATSIINRLWPDKTQQEKDQMASALAIVQGQLSINEKEAANPSVFVSGWRPAIGWVCGAACAWNWIGLKIALFVAAYLGHNLNLQPADVGEMMPVLMGMLGLGGLRTVEKINGVAAK